MTACARLAPKTEGLAQSQIQTGIRRPGAIIHRHRSESQVAGGKVSSSGAHRDCLAGREPRPVIEKRSSIAVLTGREIVRLPRIDDGERAHRETMWQ